MRRHLSDENVREMTPVYLRVPREAQHAAERTADEEYTPLSAVYRRWLLKGMRQEQKPRR